jgi:hypothetical protein
MKNLNHLNFRGQGREGRLENWDDTAGTIAVFRGIVETHLSFIYNMYLIKYFQYCAMFSQHSVIFQGGGVFVIGEWLYFRLCRLRFVSFRIEMIGWSGVHRCYHSPPRRQSRSSGWADD